MSYSANQRVRINKSMDDSGLVSWNRLIAIFELPDQICHLIIYFQKSLLQTLRYWWQFDLSPKNGVMVMSDFGTVVTSEPSSGLRHLTSSPHQCDMTCRQAVVPKLTTYVEVNPCRSELGKSLCVPTLSRRSSPVPNFVYPSITSLRLWNCNRLWKYS